MVDQQMSLAWGQRLCDRRRLEEEVGREHRELDGNCRNKTGAHVGLAAMEGIEDEVRDGGRAGQSFVF